MPVKKMGAHQRPYVLVLDDEVSIRESLAEYLEDCGYPVLMAKSAEDALALSELGEVGVAIVDIRLPVMDGPQFIKRVHDLHPHIVFLIYTGSVDFQLDEELRAMGLTERDVVYKPLLNMEIFDQIVGEKMPGVA